MIPVPGQHILTHTHNMLVMNHGARMSENTVCYCLLMEGGSGAGEGERRDSTDVWNEN